MGLSLVAVHGKEVGAQSSEKKQFGLLPEETGAKQINNMHISLNRALEKTMPLIAAYAEKKVAAKGSDEAEIDVLHASYIAGLYKYTVPLLSQHYLFSKEKIAALLASIVGNPENGAFDSLYLGKAQLTLEVLRKTISGRIISDLAHIIYKHRELQQDAKLLEQEKDPVRQSRLEFEHSKLQHEFFTGCMRFAQQNLTAESHVFLGAINNEEFIGGD